MWKRTYLVLKSRPREVPVSTTRFSRPVSTLPGQRVQYILNEIRDRGGLCKFTPHIEYLVGSNKSAFDSSAGSGNTGGGGLDIADKTQLILQSTHPVRFVVEREIRALRPGEETDLKYLDWVTIFGHSLIQSKSKLKKEIETPTDKLSLDEKLGNIGTAAECGMFSADVHQTVVNITANLQPGRLRSEFHLGNKYAVLVGDYFAIKTIYFAEKVKSSPVFLEIIRGVEDFTYSSFVSKLLESEIGYPILPYEGATIKDWTAYGTKVSGYFTGGLNAAFTLMNILQNESNEKFPYESTTKSNENLQVFVSNLALTLKAVNDLQEFKRFNQDTFVSPFLFISLPAILYQQKNKEIFSNFRGSEYVFNLERVNEIRYLISQSDAISQSRELIEQFASTAAQAFSKIRQDEFFSNVMLDLLHHAATSSDI